MTTWQVTGGLEELLRHLGAHHKEAGDVEAPDANASHEKKFLVGDLRRSIGIRELDFCARMHSVCTGGIISLLEEEGLTFTGTDDYTVFIGNGTRVAVRMRVSSNQSCRLSAKISVEGGMKRQVDVWIPYRHFQNMRFALDWVGQTAQRVTRFRIGQTGRIWMVRDSKSGHVVEIVLYRARRTDKTSTSKLFAEIDPRDCPNGLVAARIIKNLSRHLGLRKEEPRSLAEILGD